MQRDERPLCLECCAMRGDRVVKVTRDCQKVGNPRGDRAVVCRPSLSPELRAHRPAGCSRPEVDSRARAGRRRVLAIVMLARTTRAAACWARGAADEGSPRRTPSSVGPGHAAIVRPDQRNTPSRLLPSVPAPHEPSPCGFRSPGHLLSGCPVLGAWSTYAARARGSRPSATKSTLAAEKIVARGRARTAARVGGSVAPTR